ncbi:ADP-ribosylation/Crystallin J1 [Paenibacillus mucilaginosus 3016]|uniref:ADP-ribosylation/Crystallin J1 n=1 Tax=Paenibacillus mucilaginosus 3016 TaxID=1116391 RepID=H6NCM9_9BACL|nr:ADP-ribosylglycohydrolase family protein [Paenibacillus mucilaginosus]AFC28958.1 ADP-ribosylation/Crystallin J1 [Paenibacillus mucilaginosus 3016]WFA17707.1 ADP-ribosylglycohydrolase family protein [Paenibacillus mucilaginosus]
MAGWVGLQELLKVEVQQRQDEDCSVDGFLERIEAAGDNQEQLMSIYAELSALEPKVPNLNEPNELEKIRELRPEGPRVLPNELTADQWLDKFRGAWLGRAIGCALGKPLEYPNFMSGSDGRPGWENVYLWFKGANAWPINGYTPEFSTAEDEYGIKLAPYGLESTRERISYMQTDDDIRYTVLGLMMLERKGREWGSWDIGKLWHEVLSYKQVCTAETQSYLNFAQVTHHYEVDGAPADWGQKQQWVRTYLNPYREYIGAQIRADGFAYGAAGQPELAADFAWRDASFSHVRNGIYGEMFVAAMIAAAFVESNPLKLVEIGLSEIPANCRLARDIRQAVEIAQSTEDQLTLVQRIWDAFNHYDCVHTNNNAALVAASLVFAKGDFNKAISTSVLGGWDTDCNGATVGSIIGASLGASQLPAHWVEPLHDTLYSEVNGFHPIAISECARRSCEVFLKLKEQA